MTASNKYAGYVESIENKIAQLQAIINESNCNDIGWGDVANMHHVDELLAEIVEFIK